MDNNTWLWFYSRVTRLGVLFTEEPLTRQHSVDGEPLPARAWVVPGDAKGGRYVTPYVVRLSVPAGP